MEIKSNDASPREGEASKEIKTSEDKGYTKEIEQCNWRGRIISEEQPPKPEALVAIKGVAIMVRRNFTTIMGQKKTRKSLLASWIMSQVSGKIIVIDTEQSDYHVWQLQHRIKQNKKDNGEVICLYLRGLPMATKRKFIVEALNENPDTSAVMIDNIRDLLPDINDPQESHEVVEMLEHITIKYNISVLCTIHSNKTDGKIRGHIGSELENKAYLVIQTIQKGSASEIRCESSRDGDFESFYLRHQIETGLPEVLPLRRQINLERVAELIEEDTNLKREEVIQKIKGDLKVGVKKAENVLNEAVEKGFVDKTGPDRSPNVRYRKPKKVELTSRKELKQ